MTSPLEWRDAHQASESFSWEAMWSLFDGDAERINIAHECLDRHPRNEVAARVASDDGTFDMPTFGELSDESSRFAHLLADEGVSPGEPVGVMMDPSRHFYAAIFGILKRGAVAVPLYTLFGPEALRDRIEDCAASCIIVDEARRPVVEAVGTRALVYETHISAKLQKYPAQFEPTTRGDDLAVLQYTSGTTRQLPEAVRHEHRSVVTLARAALFASGIRPGDRFFTPSSPAWGHGLWHGTISPLSLGVPVGAWSGKFNADSLVDAIVHLQITNLSAASTVYRMIVGSGRAQELSGLEKASYTGEELDPIAFERFRDATGVSLCGIYGTTETGVIIVNFPGFTGHEPRPGALGKPMPGCNVTVLGDDGAPVPVGETGEISVFRRGHWLRSKDLGSIDRDGYFHYSGRADDVIISSGWTISPLEVERTLLTSPEVMEAAVVGAPDTTRGQIVKAYVVPTRPGDDQLVRRLQQLVRDELSPHEYPRVVEFRDELPKTPNGKINRRALREG